MITREDAKKMVSDLVECTCIDAYRLRNLSAPDCAACNYTLDLFDIVEQLLKERDAYRELAAEFHLNGTTSGSQFAKGMAGSFELVDAEAARIMKEKGGV